ncbi:hypothetical protein ANO11243_095440 [Dothideomycetidae sp. 11243]|nr:hypothetical protein ANO11243_095440 [fungal sp. No.11243]
MADQKKIKNAVAKIQPIVDDLNELEQNGVMAEFGMVPKDTLLPEKQKYGTKQKWTEEDDKSLHMMKKAKMTFPQIARCWPTRSVDSIKKHWAHIKDAVDVGITHDETRKENLKIVRKRMAEEAEEGEEDGERPRVTVDPSAWIRPEDWRGPVEDTCRIELHFNDYAMWVSEDLLFRTAFALGLNPIPSHDGSIDGMAIYNSMKDLGCFPLV